MTAEAPNGTYNHSIFFESRCVCYVTLSLMLQSHIQARKPRRSAGGIITTLALLPCLPLAKKLFLGHLHDFRHCDKNEREGNLEDCEPVLLFGVRHDSIKIEQYVLLYSAVWMCHRVLVGA